MPRSPIRPELDEDDAPEFTDDVASLAVPARDILSPETLSLFRRGPGRPKSDSPKTPVSLRLDADVVARFRATGDGWQSRINDLLRAASQALPANEAPPRARSRRA